MSKNLNVILGELEEDLKKMQSAREQVEGVLRSNVELTKAANGLITNTKSLITEIKTVTGSALDQFSEKITTSKEVIDRAVKVSNAHLDSNVKNIKDSINETSNIAKTCIEQQKNESLKILNQIVERYIQIEQSLIKEIKIATDGSINHFSEKLTASKEAIDGVVKDSVTRLDNNLKKIEKSINDISTIAKTTIKEQSTENLKVLNQITETHNQIKQLIEHILELDLNDSIKNININIQKFQDECRGQFKDIQTTQKWLFIGLGLLFLTSIILKFAM